MAFFDTSALHPRTLAPGVRLRITWGERIMTNIVELDAGSIVPVHRHPQEQMGVVLEGSITMTIGDETRTLGPGDIYLAPPDVEHTVVTGATPAKVVDVFSPPREEYK